jgi:putative (di)nucleoside polyphosphate hydrolase
MKYRPNVAAILQNASGRILIGERCDLPGAWQFPQGGLAKGESHAEALVRELREELSLEPEAYRVITSKGPYRYLFKKGRVKRGYHGQEQHYFLASFHGSDLQIDVETENPEFQAARWIFPHEFRLCWLPDFKREVYRAVLKDFFEVLL